MNLLNVQRGPRDLFTATWRSSCPIRPRRGRLRRFVCLSLLGVLFFASVGYTYATDEQRVRRLAQTYLGRLLGAEVTVGEASLGLFEGLRLGDVELRTPAAAGLEDEDRLLFTARGVTIDYDPFALLVGRLTADRIVAVDPHVRLVENTRNGTWNAQKLGIVSRPRKEGAEPFRPPGELPAVVLRNARVDVLHRSSGGLTTQGGFGIEANLRPDLSVEHDGAEYAFDVQTRNMLAPDGNDLGGLGPRARGKLSIGGSDRSFDVAAELTDAEFNEILGLLPERVADWARRRGLTGEMSVPVLAYGYNPSAPRGKRTTFNVRADLTGGSATVLPDLWLGADEMQLRTNVADWLGQAATRLMVQPRLAARFATAAGEWQPKPICLDDARGSVTFTQAGIGEAMLSGELEGNRIILTALSEGYARDGEIKLRVRTPEDDPLQLPAVAPYLASMPRQVREVYDRFRPRGTAEFDFTIERPAGDPRIRATGEVRVLDGSFALDRLPYRLYDGRGTLDIVFDEATERHELRIERLTARGRPGSPNADTYVRVDGIIGPLERAPGFDIAVLARGVREEPDLVQALPPPIRRSVRLFDPDYHAVKKPGLPALDFRGDLNIRVVRPPGRDKRWTFDIGVRAASFSGAFEAFAYPIRNATAELEVREDGLTLTRSRLANAGGGSAGVAGELTWGSSLASGLDYDFTIAGSNLPLDDALRAALPDAAREAVRQLGLGGRSGVTATVRGNTQQPLGYDIQLDVTEGYVWPDGTMFAVQDTRGRVRLQPGLVTLTDITATRDGADVAMSGTIGLDESGTSALSVTAANAAVDAGLYDLLPVAARDAWDWLQPSGRADAAVTYRGPTAALLPQSEEAEAFDPSALAYDISLKPLGMEATPLGLPYPFGDIRGEIRITPGSVKLDGVTAGRRDADEGVAPTFRIDGTGDLSRIDAPAGLWRVGVKAGDLPVDDALKAALPNALREGVEAIALAGVVSLDMPRLTIKTRSDDLPPDTEFAGTAILQKATLEPGVRLDDVVGRVSVGGVFASGELQSLTSGFVADTFLASGRPGQTLSADLRLDKELGELRIENITGGVAGGLLEGNASIGWAAVGQEDLPQPFDARIRVERVEVQQLLGDGFGNGSVSAELQLGGNIGEPASRRGRGSLRVVGRDLYSLPLVVGLLQVTNLALPGNLAISRAGAEVAIDGQRMVLSDLSISTGVQNAENALLVGGGEFDYDKRTWRLWLRPGRGGWDKFPVLGPFADFARGELLGSEIGGTLEEPEVRAGTLPTVRATLDRTLKDE